MSMRSLSFKTKALLIALAVITLPISYYGAKEAEAQSTDDILQSILDAVGGGLKVSIVGNTSKPDTATALQGTLSRMFLGTAAGELESINLKEMVLDPIAWNLAKKLQQQMTGDVLKWLGGQLPGQNGKVPFVKNYTKNNQDILSQVMGRYLTEDMAGDAAGTCNPEQSFNVRTAILNAYREDVNSAESGTALSCSDASTTGNVQQYSSLAHKLMSDFLECRDETCAFFEGRIESYQRALNAQNHEREIRSHSRGMEPQRVCREVEDSNGRPYQECEIVNPLYLAADNASFQLNQVPSLQLLQMDEFNEIVSSFMTQLTNEAVTGISSLANGIDFTGVLGLSGNPDYTNLLFGSDGGLSYVDSLTKEDVSQYQSYGTNPIEGALTVEQKNLSLQTFIVNEVTALETKTASNQTTFGSCYDLPLTTELKDTLDDAKVNMQIASTAVTILTTLNQQYTNSTDASTRSAAVSTYVSYKNQDLFSTEQENQNLELTFIDYTFATMVDQFKYDMAVEQQSCGGQFDYDGLISDNDSQGQGTQTGGSN